MLAVACAASERFKSLLIIFNITRRTTPPYTRRFAIAAASAAGMHFIDMQAMPRCRKERRTAHTCHLRHGITCELATIPARRRVACRAPIVVLRMPSALDRLMRPDYWSREH